MLRTRLRPWCCLAAAALEGCSSSSAHTATFGNALLHSVANSTVQLLPRHGMELQILGKAGATIPRHFSASDASTSIQSQTDKINELFAEAREEIDCARDDADTVYFDESCETARGAVQATLDQWEALLAAVAAEDKARLQRAMGLKMEQLKAELSELDHLHQ